MMDPVARFLAQQQAHIRDRSRLLLGDEDQPAPTGAALVAALEGPLAESRLLLQEAAGPAQPLVARGGDPAGGRVLLLFHTDVTDSDLEPGGARAGLIAVLAALVALQDQHGTLPFEVTLVCDPDRLDGSISLDGLALPSFDLCLWDGGGYEDGRPWLALGSHGLLRFRLRVSGAGGSLSLGALTPNPAWQLIWALAALKSPGEDVNLAGFYEAVREPTMAEIEALETISPDLERVVRRGGEPLLGLPGHQLGLVRSFVPMCTVIEMGSEVTTGHLPTAVWAEVLMTLVPEQTPETVIETVWQHLRRYELDQATLEILAAYAGWETSRTAPVIDVVRTVLTEIAGEEALVLPFAGQPAPLARLTAGVALPAIGLGTGRATWPTLEQRVHTQIRLAVALLQRLPVLVARA